ncbi:MAG: hypothetical protein Q9211_003963 [Gyalolechia sp. 1 TL-2023]
MGLSAPRKRTKFSQDPNNTAWSRSSARFGEKLLLSQGWTPGSPLGAHCASYIDNPASVSHIRINVKDNNLGLGAKNGAHGDDSPTTGLDGLQNLLGRLNGKDEELLEKEHRSRVASRRTIYAERRWGFGNFISGGFLAGDRAHLEEAENREVSDSATNIHDMVPKAGITEQGLENEKERSGREPELEPQHQPSDVAPRPSSAANPLDERVIDGDGRRHAKRSRAHTREAQQRPEKLERKAQRRARKAEKSAAKASKHKSQRPPDPLPAQLEPKKQEPMAETGSAHRSRGRHAVRQRFIQHKKMSLTNQRALNEILMIRA